MAQDVPAFQAHSETSRDASRQIAPDTRSLRERVYSLIKDTELIDHGLTDEQIAWRLSMNPSTARPRRVELERAGRIIDSGLRRKTRSGRNAVVWVAV